jgi:hypothetical protein
MTLRKNKISRKQRSVVRSKRTKKQAGGAGHKLQHSRYMTLALLRNKAGQRSLAAKIKEQETQSAERQQRAMPFINYAQAPQAPLTRLERQIRHARIKSEQKRAMQQKPVMPNMPNMPNRQGRVAGRPHLRSRKYF